MRWLALALTLLLWDPSAPLAEESADLDGYVECQVGGRKVLKRRRECLGRNSVTRDFGAEEAAGDAQWASIEGDRGVTLAPVLACRTSQALGNVISTATENRALLARVAVQSGQCTRLPRQTFFALSERVGGALRIRSAELGRLWASDAIRVPGLETLPLAGRLAPDTRDQPPAAGLSEEEQDAVKAELAAKKTVPGFVGRVRPGRGVGGSHVPGVRDGSASAGRSSGSGGSYTRSCLCTNGRTITSSRPCDEACDVQSAVGSNEVDRKGCHYKGELMDCRESGRRKGEDLARRHRGY
jgi:hypothetical protein